MFNLLISVAGMPKCDFVTSPNQLTELALGPPQPNSLQFILCVGVIYTHALSPCVYVCVSTSMGVGGCVLQLCGCVHCSVAAGTSPACSVRCGRELQQHSIGVSAVWCEP